MRPTSPRPEVVGPATPTAPFPIAVSGPVVRGFGRGSAELGIPTANIPLSGLSVGGYDDLDSGVYFGWCALDVDSDGRPVCNSGSSGSNSNSNGDGDGDGKVTEANDNDKEQDHPTKAKSATATAAAAAAAAPILNASSLLIPPFPVSAPSPGPGPVPSSSPPPPPPPPPPPKTPTKTTTTIYPMVLSLGYNPFYGNTVRSIETHVIHHFPHDFYGAHMRLLICGYVRPEYDYVDVKALVEDIRMDIRVAERSLLREGYLCFREVEGEGEGGGRSEWRDWWRLG